MLKNDLKFLLENGMLTLKGTINVDGIFDVGLSGNLATPPAFDYKSYGTVFAHYDASSPGTLWQDDERTSAVTADAQSVQAWDDLSGNNYHVKNSTAGKIPTYDADGVGGKGGVLFDELNDSLFATVGAIDIPLTWFAVAEVDTEGPDQHVIFHLADSTDNTSGMQFYHQPSAEVDVVTGTVDNFADTIEDIGYSATSSEHNTWMDAGTHVYSFVINSSASSEGLLNVDGVQVVDHFADVGGFANTIDKLSIGNNSPASFSGYTGSIGELVIYQGALTSTAIEAIEAHLIDKWTG